MHLRIMSWLVAVLVLATPVSLPVTAQAASAPPVDEAAKDPALKAVRDALLAAVRNRDMAAAGKFVSPRIQLSFGGDAGRTRLSEMLKKDPMLWWELELALANGGRFTRNPGYFEAPYWANADIGKLDSYAALIVIRPNVWLRSGPSRAAKAIAPLKFDILETVKGDDTGKAWRKVRTSTGIVGYIHKDDVRGPTDYRVMFAKSGGKWVVTSFLAGD